MNDHFPEQDRYPMPQSPTQALTSTGFSYQGGTGARIDSVMLHNGLQVVVIPDHRTPVVTHMVWYKNGSADDPVGKSGIAHFLEHLMFKGTDKHPQGAFSAMVTELGGQENAFTSLDYTAYFQRVARDHLKTMMMFEADRMTGLVLTDEVVAPERDVVLEERRMRTDTDPAAQLGEAMAAALYAHHPYGTPIIGWMHEIEDLGREDALAYYRRFYTPENAILIVAGDVTTEEVLRLAEETYGRIPPRGEAPKRRRPREPTLKAARRVTLSDPKVEQPSLQRCFIVPSYTTAAPGEAEAIDVMVQILGASQTGWLHRKLVIEQRIAVAAGGWYQSTALDPSRLMLYAVPMPGVALETLERAVEAVVAELIRDGVSEKDLARAKTRLVADAAYAQDSQSSLARMYGAALATGSTIEDVNGWPEAIETVSAEDVRAAAKRLDARFAVTGYLQKDEAA
jgi:zinc protease